MKLAFLRSFLALKCVKPAWAAIVLVVVAGWVHAAAPLAYSVTDATGVRVDFAAPPQRIVSLLPSLAETVCALGACHKLVGVDRYTVWPPEMAAVPKVGGGLDPNIEAIVALKADVVLVSASSRASARLRALGQRVVVLEPKNHAEVKFVLFKIAQVLGQPPAAAESIWQDINQRIDRAAADLPPALHHKRLYFEVSRGPYAAGESSFIGETISRLGLGNVVGKELGPFPKLNPEFVVLKNPDFILAGERHADEMMLYPGWEKLPAVKAGRFCLFSLEQTDVLIHPGPRMGQAAELIAQCVRGKIKRPTRARS